MKTTVAKSPLWAHKSMVELGGNKVCGPSCTRGIYPRDFGPASHHDDMTGRTLLFGSTIQPWRIQNSLGSRYQVLKADMLLKTSLDPAVFMGYYATGPRYHRNYQYGSNLSMRLQHTTIELLSPAVLLFSFGEDGKYQDLLMWEQMTDEVRAALVDSNFDGFRIPFKDDNFDKSRKGKAVLMLRLAYYRL
ncbi:unnamed protein product [Phytophthora lilii]|uniref:Unnamed protein product n=1 Tax=Phytophthora lilii TaxID=2077276 RepID=A0A9W7CLZ3_9STRA|nr:unnamed protein product [Phytophthora lilii]